MKLAGAPISWGVCEVPGWGHQLSPRRVLAEMRDLGLTATELGPAGFLPAVPGERDRLLAEYELEPVGAFVPAVLHDPAHDPLPEVERAMDALGSGATLILAAATGLAGYDRRPALDTGAWRTLLCNLDAITVRAGDRGRSVALHPHIGTVVERRAEVERVLGGCSVPLCLDTGHLLAGGTDPLLLARFAAPRVSHVHLKDVDVSLADRVREGRTSYTRAVREGLYRPLGQGDIDISGIIRALECSGYDGWYVMEQDAVITEEPEPASGPYEDVRASLEYLSEVAA
ncbi:TIM barrel protein [Actinomadura rugatobispora]|uniref:TIM barrel protein n=1 Tax=Actinomadura rugatobispora TaxID=1994 RepID=A0ABW0ZZS1_9ACTN|nr:sugar phosphate isomerase/epimerase [Actinomadura rugatobispora]